MPSLVVAPGTYWLTLTNGKSPPADNDYWRVSDKTPVNAEQFNKISSTTTLLDNETWFEILGTVPGPSPVPVPESLLLLGTGLLGLAGTAWRKLRK